ncbi:MAG: DUF4783 domain-containing protein [Bacteroidota bacterium]|jgi:hypothetical protein
MKFRRVILYLFLFFSLIVYADTFDDVVGALKSQNVKELSKLFNTTVELTLNDNEGVYSKQQAEMMLKNFLSRHQAKNVTIQHRGSSGQGAKYAIANYETTQGNFRVYIFMKDIGSGLLVHEIRFEKE